MAEKKEIKYNLVKHIGNISDGDKFSTKVTVGSWNTGKAKVDIRHWRSFEDGPMVPTKGISLTWDDLEIIMSEGMLEKAKAILEEHEDKQPKEKKKKSKKEDE